MPAPVLILCIGNSLRRDDGAAHVAGQLFERMLQHEADRARIDVVHAHQLLPEHALLLVDRRECIIVDAALPGALPAAHPVLNRIDEHDSGGLHGSTPARLIRDARIAFGAVCSCLQLAIPGHDFGLGETLDARTNDAVHLAVDLLAAHCAVSTIPRRSPFS